MVPVAVVGIVKTLKLFLIKATMYFSGIKVMMAEMVSPDLIHSSKNGAIEEMKEICAMPANEKAR